MTIPFESWIVAWIATYLLHSTVLVVAVLALSRWLERDPELASGAWKLALFGGIATATLQVAIGAGPNVARMELERSAAPVVEATIVALPPVEPELAALAVELGDPADLVDPQPVAAEPAPPPPALQVPSWHAVVAGVVLGGAALGLLSVVAASIALRRRVRRRAAVVSGPLAAMLGRLRARAGLRRRVELAVAAELDVPLAVGVLRPAILVPPRALDELSVEEQETMLAHELAHVLRGDPWWRYAALAVLRALAIQPLNRVAATRMARAAELACDDWAARATAQPLELARCLTEVAGWAVDRRALQLGSAMARPADALRSRVTRLLDHDRERRRAPLRFAAALAGLALPLFAWLAPGITIGCERHAPARSPHAAVVLSLDDGELAVIADDDTARPVVAAPEADDEGRADGPSERKAVAKSRRKAKKELRRAFREARKAGRAAPSDAEVDAILDRAEPDPPREAGRERVRVRIVTDEGEVLLEIDGDGSMRRRPHRREGGHEHARAEAIRALALAQAHRERARAQIEREHAHAARQHARAEAIARETIAARQHAAREHARRLEALAREHERRMQGEQRRIERMFRAPERAPRAPSPPRRRAHPAPAPPAAPPGTWWIAAPPAPAPPAPLPVHTD